MSENYRCDGSVVCPSGGDLDYIQDPPQKAVIEALKSPVAGVVIVTPSQWQPHGYSLIRVNRRLIKSKCAKRLLMQ